MHDKLAFTRGPHCSLEIWECGERARWERNGKEWRKRKTRESESDRGGIEGRKGRG